MLDSNTITIIFGLTSGILTMVGLTSIFVSINSQHNMQKGRELIWKIVALPLDINKYSLPENGEKLCQYFWLYRDIMASSGGLTNKMVYLSQVAITVVSLIWTVVIYFSYFSLEIVQFAYVGISTVICVIILFFFMRVLGKLNNATETANLPTYDSLLDANSSHNMSLHTTALIGIGSSLKITRKNDFFNVEVGVVLPFKNAYISVLIVATDATDFYSPDRYMEIIDNTVNQVCEINGEGYLMVGTYERWYNLTKFKLEEIVFEKAAYISFQLDISCSKGYSQAAFKMSVDEIRKMSNWEHIVLFPIDVSNHYVPNGDKTLRPWGTIHAQ